jgi:cell division transport system permease protein
MYRILYILRQSVILLNHLKKAATIAVIFLTIGFATIGSSYIFGKSFFESSLSLKNKVEMTVFFKSDVSINDVSKSIDEIKAMDGVSNVTLITNEQAKDIFVKMFPQYTNLVNSLDENPFPYTAKIQISNLQIGSNIKALIQTFPTVDSVVFSEDVARKVNNLTKIAWLLFVFVFIVVVAEFIFISQSIISLLIDLRRGEIKILHLIGADPVFVNLPFIFVVLFITFISWITSVFILKKVNVWSVGIIRSILPFANYTSSIQIGMLSLYLLLFGILVSLVGGVIPLKKVKTR